MFLKPPSKVKLVLLGISVVGLILLLWRLDHLTNKVDTQKTTITSLEKTNEAVKEVAHKAVNRPRTDDDVTSRLCSWASRQYKHETGEKLQLPNGPCN
jgi:hypothetical protein